jgi:alkylation response protein AidB-like acyl-CoA dehydrogenase
VSETRHILEESVLRLLTQRWDPAARRHEPADWAGELWQDIAELGLPRAMVAESRDGGGLTLAEGLALIRTVSGHPVPVPLPLAEVMVASYLLDRAGLDIPAGLLTIAPVVPGEELLLRQSGQGWLATGVLRRVPWGHEAEYVVAGGRTADGVSLARVHRAHARIEAGTNLAGEPRDTLILKDAPVEALARCAFEGGDTLRSMAVVRTVQIAASCRTALTIALEHARSRIQFGRPIGQFQAVQQNLAVMAGQIAAAAGAAELAVEAIAGTGDPSGVALGKIRAGEAAGQVAALAHQILGAMGFTHEHPLHFTTKRLLSWRDECGAENYWAEQAGRAVFAAGGAQFWPLLSAT